MLFHSLSSYCSWSMAALILATTTMTTTPVMAEYLRESANRLRHFDHQDPSTFQVAGYTSHQNPEAAKLFSQMAQDPSATAQEIQQEGQAIDEEAAAEQEAFLGLLGSLSRIGDRSLPLTEAPTVSPPTRGPSITTRPTEIPSSLPSVSPTQSTMPTVMPSAMASAMPNAIPSTMPSTMPSITLSTTPSTMAPSAGPTDPAMTFAPTIRPSSPTVIVTLANRESPTVGPSTASPTVSPTAGPTASPTTGPTASPTTGPTASPTADPTASPSSAPTQTPTALPSAVPTTPVPSHVPSDAPTRSVAPSAAPFAAPTLAPTTALPTSVPTLANCGISALEREQRLLALLVLATNTSVVELNNAETPQGLATEWLLNQDEAVVCPDNDKALQRWVLAVMYYSTSGDGWLRCSANPAALDDCGNEFPFQGATRFLSAGTECDWAGIACLNGCVSEIDFEENDLIGTIPTEIGLLSDLAIWAMERGGLSSTIPTEVGRLTNLIFLDFDFNSLTGTLPAELFTLTRLTQLDVNDNQLTGSINNIGVFTDMEFLQLHGNDFTGIVPTNAGSLTKLAAFTLHRTLISGDMPSEVCDLFNPPGRLSVLIADCAGPAPDITCSCCTSCRF